MPYMHVQIARFFLIFFLTTHWMACAWCFVATGGHAYADGYGGTEGLGAGYTWVDALAAGKLTGDIYTGHAFETYLAALHFSVMTTTSVPENTWAVAFTCWGGFPPAFSLQSFQHTEEPHAERERGARRRG
jgi:hypothetical protein